MHSDSVPAREQDAGQTNTAIHDHARYAFEVRDDIFYTWRCESCRTGKSRIEYSVQRIAVAQGLTSQTLAAASQDANAIMLVLAKFEACMPVRENKNVRPRHDNPSRCGPKTRSAHVRLVRLRRNLGDTAAPAAGMEYSNGRAKIAIRCVLSVSWRLS